MVPQEETTSNHLNGLSATFTSQSQAVLATSNNDCKGKVETSFTSDAEKIFDILAEWNEYLENHVPHFSEGADDP